MLAPSKWIDTFSGSFYGRVFSIVPPRVVRLGLGWVF
jgi:hypothetical protein